MKWKYKSKPSIDWINTRYDWITTRLLHISRPKYDSEENEKDDKPWGTLRHHITRKTDRNRHSL